MSSPLPKQQIVELISENGLFSRSVKGFEARLSQQKMMSDVVEAYNHNQIALIEAGTGTGKTLAYLLPALLWASTNSEKTVIATHTIALQEQLVHKDIPEALKVLNLSLKVVLVKGMNNYVCLRKLQETRYELGLVQNEEQREVEAIDQYCRHAVEGCKSELPFIPSSIVWEQVGADSESCSMNQCPFYEQCYFIKARRAAQEAHLLVVNHHLLFYDLFKRLEDGNYADPCVLPAYKRIVFDEAHHVEEIATEYFADRLQRLDLMHALGRLSNDKVGVNRGRLPILKDKIQMAFNKTPTDEAGRIVSRLMIDFPAMRHTLSEQIHELFDRLAHYIQKHRHRGINGDREQEVAMVESKLRLLPSHQKDQQWLEEIVPKIASVIGLVTQYSTSIRHLEVDLKSIEHDKLHEQTKSIRFEIQSLMGRFDKTIHVLNTFLIEWKEPSRVRWLELQALRTLVNIHLVNADLDISHKLVDALFSKFSTVILCSATMTSNRRFSFMRDRLGLTPKLLPNRQVTENIYDSPFDYKKQALLAIPIDMPAPNHESFNEAAFQNIWHAIQACHGQAFVLFTSYSMMKSCYEALGEKLKAGRFPLLKQGDETRKQLLKKFKSTPRAVLFGTDSFWEGVDVAGDALRCVIIVKLPFQVPSEPMVEARTENIIAEGGNPFFDYSIPHAVVKFKQGFGRLIRQRSDRGTIICLDNRLVTKGYGKIFLDSLPPCERLFVPGNVLWPQIEEFYKKTYHFVKKSSFSS